MKLKIPNLTPQQLKVYEVVSRVRMAWCAMITLLVFEGVGLSAFLVAAYYRERIASGVLGGIDTLLAASIIQVYRHLFPTKGLLSGKRPKS